MSANVLFIVKTRGVPHSASSFLPYFRVTTFQSTVLARSGRPATPLTRRGWAPFPSKYEGDLASGPDLRRGGLDHRDHVLDPVDDEQLLAGRLEGGVEVRCSISAAEEADDAGEEEERQ